MTPLPTRPRHSPQRHHAGQSHIHLHSPPAPPSGTFSPGFSSVIVMKGNGPEKGRKETFLLITPTVGGANSLARSEASGAPTHVPTVYLLQDDGRNNIGLIVKHQRKKHISCEASGRMRERSNSNSFVSLREYTLKKNLERCNAKQIQSNLIGSLKYS